MHCLRIWELALGSEYDIFLELRKDQCGWSLEIAFSISLSMFVSVLKKYNTHNCICLKRFKRIYTRLLIMVIYKAWGYEDFHKLSFTLFCIVWFFLIVCYFYYHVRIKILKNKKKKSLTCNIVEIVIYKWSSSLVIVF